MRTSGRVSGSLCNDVDVTDTRQPEHHPIASVVIPAHNEERGIARLLTGLTSGVEPGEIEIVVVCNGCTDATADVARDYGNAVTVVELDQPSKRDALRHGDAEATAYPRLYVDADVELSGESVKRLSEVLSGGSVLAAAPARVLPRTGVNPLVSWYYDVWEELPQVRSGLFGRGVIALSQEANERIRALPPMMSDDLVMSEAFRPAERSIVESAVVVVRPPKKVRDLLRRRVRSATGNAQADSEGLRSADAQTSPRVLVEMMRAKPSLALRMPVFVGLTMAGKIASRRAIKRGDFSTWLRDESSRT